jgi:DNA-binding NarL/FixJ family response regulator
LSQQQLALDALASPAQPAVGSCPLRVAVMADVALYRHALTTLIAGQGSAHLVGTAATLEQTVELARTQRPDVLVVDMASHGVLSVLEAVRAAAPEVKLVAFAVNEQEEDVMRCAEAGVAGFVTRGATPDRLLSVIESAMRGELLCSPRIAALLFHRVGSLARRRAAGLAPVPLTDRERQIAALLADGLCNKEIAVQLRIEVPTVKNHVHRILAKLRVTSRLEAAAQLRTQLRA